MADTNVLQALCHNLITNDERDSAKEYQSTQLETTKVIIEETSTFPTSTPTNEVKLLSDSLSDIPFQEKDILDFSLPLDDQELAFSKRKKSDDFAETEKRQKSMRFEEGDVSTSGLKGETKLMEQQKAASIDQILNSFSCLDEEVQVFEPFCPSVSEEVVDIDEELQKMKTGSGEEEKVQICLNPHVLEQKNRAEKPVYIYQDLASRLKKHQIKGVQFLWSHIALEPEGTGCILADFMGLGKTLQVISVAHAFLTAGKTDEDKSDTMYDTISKSPDMRPRNRHVLILAPTICVRNWEAEMVRWLGRKEVRRLGLSTLESNREKKMEERISIIQKWYQRGGVMIMGYEIFRILILQASGQEPIRSKKNKPAKQLVQSAFKYLCDPGPDLIVLDEGHRVRDPKSKLVQALSNVKTRRRVILTGYPLQNHLVEYWTMVNFARPNHLGTLDEFKNKFVHPIQNGQCVDSSVADVRLARQRAFLLTQDLKSMVLRRDQQFLYSQLPPKKEWVLIFKLSELQSSLYRRFLECGVPKRNADDVITGGKVDVLGGYHISLAISNHPDVLYEAFQILEKNPTGIKKRQRQHIEDVSYDYVEDELDGLLACDTFSSEPYDARGSNSWGMVSSENISPVIDGSDDDDSMSGEYRRAHAHKHRLSFAAPLFRDFERRDLDLSGKMVVLFEILEACQEIGDRVIVFSQSIATLNVIEMFIAQRNNRLRRSRKNHDKAPFTSLRIDGSTSQQDRFRQIEQFNDPEEVVDVIFISTKAGGEGINLCAGNRIVIFDVCWNPCNDAQSMCRSYRFGQNKPVFVYRFVAGATMEKKVYDLQIRKEGVAKQIVDDKALERKFKQGDLQKYFDIDHFEEALAAEEGQAVTVIASSAEEEEAKGKNTNTIVTENLTKLDKMLLAPQEDVILDRVLRKMSSILSVLEAYQGERTSDECEKDEAVADWIVDWFEQETMFEENLDQQCSPKEQEEIMETHKYNKAVRRHKRTNVTKSDAVKGNAGLIVQGIKVARCAHCNTMTELYPESVTKVKTPRYIDCSYCNRSILTSAAIDPTIPAPQPMYKNNAMFPGPLGFAYAMHPFPGQIRGANDPGQAQQNRILPPHLYRLCMQQQLQRMQSGMLQKNAVLHAQAPVQARSSNTSGAVESKALSVSNLKFSERHLLIIRRGLRGCQELKRQAEACGATIAIEVSSQLTDIVSSMSLAETLKWLKLTKLPRDVEFHPDSWLREQIQLQSKNTGQQTFLSETASNPTNSVAAKQETANPQIFSIEDDDDVSVNASDSACVNSQKTKDTTNKSEQIVPIIVDKKEGQDQH